jgi:putative ABC transport system permease protein
MRLTLVRVTLGMVASFVVARLVASLLFGTKPTDPATFVGMAVLLCAVALVAGFIPAHRASRIDPMVALRSN